MARAAFWFAAVGVILAVLAVLLPHGSSMNTEQILLAAVCTAPIAIVAAFGYDRLPPWVFHFGAVWATVVATAAIHAWGGEGSYGSLPYLWVTVYVFYFFSLPAALIHMAVLGVLFGVELGGRDLDHQPVSDWVATMGTLISGGLLVAVIRDRLTSLISNLTDAARTDSLTGLLNRRGFEDAFEVEIERTRRGNQTLSVIVGDLDRFKTINDRFGHAVGDDALRRVGDSICRSKRSWDTAARIGGEEFAILAPNTDQHGAYGLSERLRTGIEQTFDAMSVGPLTSSFGIVSFPIHGETPAALLQAADQALYAAKTLGRNRSLISSAEVPGILSRGSRDRDDAQVGVDAMVDLAEALDIRESGSTTHCRRVGRFAELIARELGLAPEVVERVRIAGILHDVGWVGVPEGLLQKGGELTDEEWEWIHSHPATGARLLETTQLAEVGDWILAHHERPDGTGYPEGCGPDEVPLEASILAVADAYEAMTAPRPYRAALDRSAASEELREGAGRQFDKRVVEALLRVV